jgi:hypothetical protein
MLTEDLRSLSERDSDLGTLARAGKLHRNTSRRTLSSSDRMHIWVLSPAAWWRVGGGQDVRLCGWAGYGYNPWRTWLDIDEILRRWTTLSCRS